mgnify:CR=1 FL=1
MLFLATFFLCLSLLGGLKMLCLVMRLSFFKYDFKNIYKDPETRQFAIWLSITIVSLLICFFYFLSTRYNRLSFYFRIKNCGVLIWSRNLFY